MGIGASEIVHKSKNSLRSVSFLLDVLGSENGFFLWLGKYFFDELCYFLGGI